jgi:hypothetical protein
MIRGGQRALTRAMTTSSSKRFVIPANVLFGMTVGDDRAPAVFAKSQSEDPVD